MFSDTHCHLSHIASRGVSLESLIMDMTNDGYRAAVDIGTKPGDLSSRRAVISSACGGSIPVFIHFSCGIWPDADSIADPDTAMRSLEDDVRDMISAAQERATAGYPSFAALGECGLDRFWNGTGKHHEDVSVDGPGTDDLAGEEALFCRQIQLAQEYRLPLVIHSRDAFDATLSILKSMNYHHGVIHCFSYGIAEARAFLDLGWFISFPGNITFAKKEADREHMQHLVSYIPDDLLLLETDAPYLAPVPHRGIVNTPWHVRFVYEKAAEFRHTDSAALAETVFANATTLFGLTAE